MTIDRNRLTARRGALFSNVLPNERFDHWRNGKLDVGQFLDQSILGEVFWRKNIGRPEPPNSLSDALEILVWTVEAVAPDSAHPNALEPVNHPRSATIWDGADDAHFWRVSFQITGVLPGYHGDPFDDGLVSYDDITYIVPRFKRVSWAGEFGLSVSQPYRVLVPYEIHLIKGPHADHVSVEVVRSNLMPAHVKTPYD